MIYKYDEKRYLFAVTIPTIFMFIILVYSLMLNIKDPQINIYTLYIIVCIYGISNNLISVSNPKMIIDDGKQIKFYSFGRTHEYEWEQIKRIRIKEFYNKKIYLRIDNPGLLKGRYWIKSAMYNNGEELYIKLKNLEEKLHQDTMEFRNKYH